MAAQQPKSSKTDLASLVSLAVLLALPLVVRFGRSAAQILQNGPRQLGQLGCAPLLGRFGLSAAQIFQNGLSSEPLSSPNPSKRTSPNSAWLCSLALPICWSVLSAERPKSSKTDLASLVCLAVLLALPLVVRFGRSAAQILPKRTSPPNFLSLVLPNPGTRQLGLVPFWPLSSPNPPKRTSPAWSG